MHYSPRCTVNRVVTMAILTGAGQEGDLTSVIYSAALNCLEIRDGSPYCQKRIGGLFMYAVVRYTVCVNVLRESGSVSWLLAAGQIWPSCHYSFFFLIHQHLQLDLFMTLRPDLLSFRSSCFS